MRRHLAPLLDTGMSYNVCLEGVDDVMLRTDEEKALHVQVANESKKEKSAKVRDGSIGESSTMAKIPIQ